MKQYNPQKAKRGRGQSYSAIQTRELNKHYVNYFTFSREAKSSLAESLGITQISLTRWMRKKRQEERDLEEAKNQLQKRYKQEPGQNVAGVLTPSTHESILGIYINV